MDKFKQNFKAAAKAAGYTTDRQAAAALGWSAGRLCNYTSGRRPVDLVALAHIAATFGVSPGSLVNDEAPGHDLHSILCHVLLTEGIRPAKADKIAQIVCAMQQILAQPQVDMPHPQDLSLALLAARSSLSGQ